MIENKRNIDHLIIAHRGESFDAPENTLASVMLAWERGARAVEIDVQLTKDDYIVVIHDKNTKRVGMRNKAVRHQTLEEIRQLDVGEYKGEKWRGEKIPLLTEILCTVPSNGKIIIEIKCGKEIIPSLKEEIKQSGLKPVQVEVIAFNLQVISEAKRIMEEHKALWLLSLDYFWIKRFFPVCKKQIIEKVKKHNLDGLNVCAGKKANERFIKTIQSANLEIYLWTINDPKKAYWYFLQGVKGITTDRAQWMIQSLVASP